MTRESSGCDVTRTAVAPRKTANWDAAKKSLDVVQKRVNLCLETRIKALC
jgi:hypothetical protein